MTKQEDNVPKATHKGDNKPQALASKSEKENYSREFLRRERTTADEALQGERNRANSFSELGDGKRISQERQDIDDNLSYERNKTDAEVRRSEDDFTKERDDHIVTKAALTSRDEFLAIVSHDLRNPISSISMATSLLLQSPSCIEQDKTLLEMIRRNADAALRLIEDLLDIERLAQGKFSLGIEKQDLLQVLRQSMESFQQAAAAKSISLRFVADTGPAIAFCDRNRITQVLTNLIGNAIKFTPESGQIILELTDYGEDFEIIVSDNGPGIPLDSQRTIFERFSQISKKDRSGLGLGLYIAKMIIEAQKGRIWVKSEVGRGSEFHFTLPRHS